MKPFDECMSKAMQETMKYLCENIQGCVLGYTQSDEISLVLIDYQKQLEGLNVNQVQELLFKEINWNDYPTKYRRGSCCIGRNSY